MKPISTISYVSVILLFTAILPVLTLPVFAYQNPRIANNVQCADSLSQAILQMQSTNSPVNLKVCVQDNYGNRWNLKVTGTTTSYTISGSLFYSPYLPNTPWSTSGSGSGLSFTYTSNDPYSNNGACSFQYSGTVNTHTKSASGSWQNTTCTGTGSFTLTACTASSTSQSNIAGRPGER